MINDDEEEINEKSNKKNKKEEKAKKEMKNKPRKKKYPDNNIPSMTKFFIRIHLTYIYIFFIC